MSNTHRKVCVVLTNLPPLSMTYSSAYADLTQMAMLNAVCDDPLHKGTLLVAVASKDELDTLAITNAKNLTYFLQYSQVSLEEVSRARAGLHHSESRSD